MSTEKKISPLKQGDLDGLCSVYAAFNIVRYISETDFMSITDDYKGACKIFAIPFNKKIVDMDVVLNGAEVDVVLKILELLKKKYKNFTYRQLTEEENLSELLLTGPILMGFSGLDNHWTVLTHSDKKHYHVFDSSVYTKFKISDVIFTKKHDAKKICINPSELIHIMPLDKGPALS